MNKEEVEKLPVFTIIASGDLHELISVVRDYDFGCPANHDKYVINQFMQEILDSRQRDDEDSYDGSVSFCPDDLMVLAEVLRRWLLVASRVTLNVSGNSDEARFEAAFIKEGKKNQTITATCESRLKDNSGKISEAAFSAYKMLNDVFNHEKKGRT